MNFWLVKTEPESYSFEDLVKEGRTRWDGVRNFQASHNLKAMQKGDLVFVYHSVSEKAVVGIAKVDKEHYPDPTNNPDGRWPTVDMVPVKPVNTHVTLAEIKQEPALQELKLIRQSRLSVVPMNKAEFDHLLNMTDTTL